MVQKVYFDLTWNGPTIKTNEAGDVISNDKTDKSKLRPFLSPIEFQN